MGRGCRAPCRWLERWVGGGAPGGPLGPVPLAEAVGRVARGSLGPVPLAEAVGRVGSGPSGPVAMAGAVGVAPGVAWHGGRGVFRPHATAWHVGLGCSGLTGTLARFSPGLSSAKPLPGTVGRLAPWTDPPRLGASAVHMAAAANKTPDYRDMALTSSSCIGWNGCPQMLVWCLRSGGGLIGCRYEHEHQFD